MMKQRAIGTLNNELVWYGGLLCTRVEVYRDVLKVSGNAKIADAYAYGWAKKAAPEERTEEMLKLAERLSQEMEQDND